MVLFAHKMVGFDQESCPKKLRFAQIFAVLPMKFLGFWALFGQNEVFLALLWLSDNIKCILKFWFFEIYIM
jgi:hypothetical protein